ncbi:hypothetical protein AMATHDRAFT_3796 [Amanita thiersii Skay4041]|uniref:Uncharacterized protein n=1 Tax=Amanita thiersii Skay4041 TaxID=703135 RepID=A0A2A9NMR7_9AGAR|nr:hypothetical protein AMATHDRAFT_3796 [Amanita thiersii Skay4041]
MPLFGSHKKKNTTTEQPSTRASDMPQQGVGMGTTQHQPFGAGTGTGIGTGPTLGQEASQGLHQHGANYPSTGTGARAGSGGATYNYQGQPASQDLGSEAVRSKGWQKEQEAKTYISQSGELSEAERLEREAIRHRQRAVEQGAHPDNRPLGGSGGPKGAY